MVSAYRRERIQQPGKFAQCFIMLLQMSFIKQKLLFLEYSIEFILNAQIVNKRK